MKIKNREPSSWGVINKLLYLMWTTAFSVLIMTSFRLVDVGKTAVYFNIILIGLISIFINESRVSDGIRTLMISLLAFVNLLIVIDPIEVGLYGYDPATTLHIYHLYKSFGVLTAISAGGWPGMYILMDTLTTILDVSVGQIGKYLPLVSIIVPYIFFLGLRRVAGSKASFYACLSLVYIKTFRGFEAKLVDEIPAMIAFYFIVYLFLSSHKLEFSGKRVIVLYVVFLTLAIVSHPILAIASITLLLTSGLLLNLQNYRKIIMSQNKVMSSTLTAIAAGIAVTVLIFWGINSKTVVGIMIGLTQLGGSPSWNVGGGQISSLRRTIVYYGTIGLIIFWSLQTFLTIINRKDEIENWQLSFAVFAGGVTILYFFQLFAGRIIAYDPARYLLLFVPLTSAVIFYNSVEIRMLPNNSFNILLIILFIIVHSIAIPPHVLVSNPNKTTTGEGNYTPQQYQSTYWVQKHLPEHFTIIAYEIELWRYIDRHPLLYPMGCSSKRILVKRLNSLSSHTNYDKQDKIYTSRDVQLYDCFPSN